MSQLLMGAWRKAKRHWKLVSGALLTALLPSLLPKLLRRFLEEWAWDKAVSTFNYYAPESLASVLAWMAEHPESLMLIVTLVVFMVCLMLVTWDLRAQSRGSEAQFGTPTVVVSPAPSSKASIKQVPRITGDFSRVRITRHGVITSNRADIKQQWMVCGLSADARLSTDANRAIGIKDIRLVTHKNIPSCRTLNMVTQVNVLNPDASHSFKVNLLIEYLYDGGNAIPSSLEMIVVDEFGAEHHIHLRHGEALPCFP